MDANLFAHSSNTTSANATVSLSSKESLVSENGCFRQDSLAIKSMRIPYCLIIFVSLIGNSLVLAVVFTNPRMRTTVNNYIVNLAVTDLLITFYMPRVISLALFGYDPPQPSANDCLCIYCSSHQF